MHKRCRGGILAFEWAPNDLALWCSALLRDGSVATLCHALGFSYLCSHAHHMWVHVRSMLPRSIIIYPREWKVHRGIGVTFWMAKLMQWKDYRDTVIFTCAHYFRFMLLLRHDSGNNLMMMCFSLTVSWANLDTPKSSGPWQKSPISLHFPRASQ